MKRTIYLLLSLSIAAATQLYADESTIEEVTVTASLIDELSVIFVQQGSTTSVLISSILSTSVTTVVGLAICFLILKFLFRKDPKPIDLLIISFFSSVPGLLVFPVLFIQDPLVQALLVLITSIYSLITFGSGIKQVYLLRNIEVVLVVIALTFGGSLIGLV